MAWILIHLAQDTHKWWSVVNTVMNYMINLLTAVVLSSGGSSAVHIYTQTVHRTTQITIEQYK
jgi:hypothetical protein